MCADHCYSLDNKDCNLTDETKPIQLTQKQCSGSTASSAAVDQPSRTCSIPCCGIISTREKQQTTTVQGPRSPRCTTPHMYPSNAIERERNRSCWCATTTPID